MFKSVLAVVLGYLIFGLSAVVLFALTGRDPHAPAPVGFILLTVVYGIVFAAAGGYAAAAFAPRKLRLHATIVGALIAIGAVIALVATPADSRWSQLSALLLMAPAALFGGMLRDRRS